MDDMFLPCALWGSSLALIGYWWATRRDSRLSPRRPADGHSAERVLRSRWFTLGPWAALGVAAVLQSIGLKGPWVSVAFAWAALAFIVSREAASRKRKWIEEIKAQWPLMLEGMATASASGLDLRTSFQAAAKRTTGALRQEMDKVSLRAAGGLSLSQALTVMEKDGVQDARRLRSMLVQAEVLGTPMSTVLTALAEEADDEARQEAEHRFNALPIKLSLVTVAFLLPPVLIVAIVPHLLVFLRSRW